jgi:hypothetical protein
MDGENQRGKEELKRADSWELNEIPWIGLLSVVM